MRLSSETLGCGRSGRLAVTRRQGEVACSLLRAGDQVNDAHAQLLSNGNGRRAAGLFNNQGFGMKIVQIELEFIGAIGWIQGRTGHAAGTGHEAGGHLRPVGQHDRHPIVAANAQRIDLL